MQEITVDKTYRHYKGKLYKVVAIAVDTEFSWVNDPNKISNAQRRVIYHAVGEGHSLPHDILWDRSYEMFAGTVNVDGKEQYRFTPYQPETDIITAWKDFLASNSWEQLIACVEPIVCGCGIVYALPNYLKRPNESIAIADMRTITVSEPHYHPETEVYFVLKGGGSMVIGGKEQAIATDDIITTPPNTAHFVMPDKDCVIAVVNTPPYNVNHYKALTETDLGVGFDAQQFKKLSQKNIVEQL